MVHLYTLNEHSDDSCRMVIAMDPDSRAVSLGNGWIRLTSYELRILHALMAAEGRAVSKHEIKDRVWGYQCSDDTLNHRIKSLRDKIGQEIIKTVYGYGYRLSMAESHNWDSNGTKRS